MRPLTGRLLYVCEVVRVGNGLFDVGLRPVRACGTKFLVVHTSTASSPRIQLGPEFLTEVSFLRLLVAGGSGSLTGHFSAPLYYSYMPLPAFTMWSDASGDAMAGSFLGPEPGLGVWWRLYFDDEVRERLRATIRDWNDLSIDVFELLGMLVSALIFVA